MSCPHALSDHGGNNLGGRRPPYLRQMHFPTQKRQRTAPVRAEARPVGLCAAPAFRGAQSQGRGRGRGRGLSWPRTGESPAERMSGAVPAGPRHSDVQGRAQPAPRRTTPRPACSLYGSVAPRRLFAAAEPAGRKAGARRARAGGGRAAARGGRGSPGSGGGRRRGSPRSGRWGECGFPPRC